MTYAAFAEKILATGLITDPWLAGQPRFREEPVILAAAQARAMARAAESIAEVYNELCLLVSDDPDSLDSFFCLTPYQKAMWLASQPLWHAVARADVFVTREGLQIAELNCDTPTGEAEAVVLGELAKRDGLTDPNTKLAARIVEAAELVAGDLPDKKAALVYPTEHPEDLPLVRLYKRELEARGWSVSLGSPYNLSYEAGRLRLFDAPISLVVRHYKTDWWSERQSAWDDEDVPDTAPLEEPLDALLAAMLDGKCAVVNPLGAVVPQNKRAMAFMWERIHRFSSKSQDTIRTFIPPTRRLEAIHKEQLLAQKDEWVLKSDYGAEGDEVVIGKLTTPEIWAASLKLARPGRWVVQRFFEATDDVNYGVFVVAGEAAGFYVRVQAGPTDDRALSAPVLLSESPA
jgi:glutathionylspermidine synthase